MSLVKEFHEAFDLPRPPHPTQPDADLAALRMRLISEEFAEVKVESDKLIIALRRGGRPDVIVPILQALVKELCDLRYVADGALVAYGIDPDAAFEEVHRSNMSKLGADGRPLYREDGKVLKGPGYTQADPDKMFPPIIEGTYEEVDHR